MSKYKPTKQKHMQESLIKDLERYKDPTQLNGTDYYRLPINKLEHLITEVWNEAIKECEGCVPEEHVRFEDEIDFNRNEAHNSCREQTLQAISKLRV